MPRIGQFTRDKNKPTPEWDAWNQKPSDENFSALYKSVEPTVRSALKSFGAEDPSLRTRAKILAAQAFKTYDPSKGASLQTHVYHNLQRLHRYRAERSSAVHIPENTRLDAGSIKKYVVEYEATHGVEPSDAQLSDALDMSMGRIKRARGIGEVSGSQLRSEKGDMPAQDRNADQIWADYVYHDLGEKDKKIFEWTTGHNGQKILPKHEIARRLRITPAAVSQRVGRIAAKLQEGVR